MGGMAQMMQNCGMAEMMQNMQNMAQQQHTTVPKGEDFPQAPVSFGSSGPGVEQLQRQLIDLGLLTPEAIRYRAGFFGPKTRAAIAELQTALGSEPSGIFDEALRTHLVEQLSAIRGTSFPEAPAANPWSEPAVEPKAPEPENVQAAAESVPEAEVPEVPAEMPEVPAEMPAPVVVEDEVPASVVDEAAAAEQVAQDAEANERAALLIAMGFSEQQVEGALAATQGSLERAADWLFVNRSEVQEVMPAEPQFPVEWEALLADLEEMGFETQSSKEALFETKGDVKEAVRTLISAERQNK